MRFDQQNLATELAQYKITVNAYAPGIIDTQLCASMLLDMCVKSDIWRPLDDHHKVQKLDEQSRGDNFPGVVDAVCFGRPGTAYILSSRLGAKKVCLGLHGPTGGCRRVGLLHRFKGIQFRHG
jgi:NAD(P)-dependent dehydrogenase (short-subunit alcohol dehydrogenase family)